MSCRAEVGIIDRGLRIGETDRLPLAKSTTQGLPMNITDTALALSSWLPRRCGDFSDPVLFRSESES